MMTSKQLKQAHALIEKIAKAEDHLAKYGKAGEVIIALPQTISKAWPKMTEAEVTLTAAEIGGAVVAALEARVDAMKKELREIGVEWTEGLVDDE